MRHKLINKTLILAGMILFVFFSSCEKKVEINPETARQMITHRNLGLAYLEEGRFIDAADEFKTLIDIFPDEPLGYGNLGLTYMQMSGELKQAEKWLLADFKVPMVNSNSIVSQIFQRYQSLLKVRSNYTAFHLFGEKNYCRKSSYFYSITDITIQY